MRLNVHNLHNLLLPCVLIPFGDLSLRYNYMYGTYCLLGRLPWEANAQEKRNRNVIQKFDTEGA